LTLDERCTLSCLRHQRLRGPAFILDAPQLIGALHPVAEFNSERAMLPISSRRSVSSTTISKSPVENARVPPKIGSRSKQVGEHQKRKIPRTSMGAAQVQASLSNSAKRSNGPKRTSTNRIIVARPTQFDFERLQLE
jgi:hypothetical protein